MMVTYTCDYQIKAELYVAETEDTTEGGSHSKLLLKLKKNKTEIVERLTQDLWEDSEDTTASPSTHERLWRLLCGVKNDILDTTNTNTEGESEVWLNVSTDEILNLRDTIFDDIELNQKTDETI